jgi:zinc finger protein
VLCKNCNYKHTDILITSIKEPVRYEYKISKESDMHVRIVRSSTGIIKIPELGAVIEPCTRGEAIISNIEGILERVERIVLHLGKEPESKAKAQKILEKIKRLRNGKGKATLILEDPLGNSAIISPRAKREILKNS